MSKQRVFIVGTRAQLIKVAPVIVACERRGLASHLLMTGQHQETMADLIEEFGITTPPVAVLPASERATVTSLLRWLPQAYRGIRRILRELSDDHTSLDVIVHGDTLSTVLGAVAGWRSAAQVIHLESGLSSGKLFDPFPEEISRRIVFRLTNVAMCPNPEALEYMQKRHPRSRAINTGGNTIADAVALVGAAAEKSCATPSYMVASLHRFQNIYDGRRLHDLVLLIEHVATKYSVHFVLHPATRKRLIKEGLLERLSKAPGIVLSPRLGYGDFMRLAAAAACVLTDGGSNQEELAILGVPTIVMRNATERPDGLGANATMEGDVPDVAAYLLASEFHSLRRLPARSDSTSPSAVVADFLAGSA